MILELHDHLGYPVKIHATRVLICQDNGTPSAFAIDIESGWLRHFRAGDPDFNDQLRYHGIDRTVVVSSFDKDLKILK